MIPRKFTLEGSHGIKAGLNRDSITMDFTTIPEDAITVAIRGDNGTGKSTILNLGLTPFRQPPHVGDIYSHFGAKGLRELEFEHNGLYYKSKITVSQTEKSKSMTSMLHVYNGDWVPVVTDDNTISDGKNGTYDKCLEFILGPKSIYFMSAFKCQNAKPLADHDDPKSLMRDLLSLDEPDQFATSSNEVAKYLKQQLESKRVEIESINDDEKQQIINHDVLVRLNAQLPALKTGKQTAIDANISSKINYENALTSNNDNAEIKKQHDDLGQKKTDIENDHATENKRLNTQTQTLETRMQSNKILMSSADDVTKAEKQIPILEDELEQFSKTLTTHRKSLTKVQQLQSDLRNHNTQCANIASSGKALSAKFEDLKKRSEFVDQVPCGGEAPYNTCPALKDAICAKTRIPEEHDLIVKSREAWHEQNDSITHVNDQIKAHGNIDQLISTIESQISQTNISLTKARNTAAKRVALNQAASIIDETNVELTITIDEKSSELQKYADRVGKVNEEIAALPPLNPSDQLQHASDLLQKTENELIIATNSLERCLSNITLTEAKFDDLKDKLKNTDFIKNEVENIANELASWKLLTLALKGVVDLSIEDAGPAISGIANQLLNEAYGPRFTLNIVTQKLQNNSVLKETFDISVIDAQSGIESSIVKKSGGEMVWLDKALRDSVGLYHKDAANVDYECSFEDEAEDGLTNERKEQLYRMNRAALSMGGYKRQFSISHNPAAWENADYVIDLGEFRNED